MWRDQAECLAAEARLLIGQVDQAETLFAGASELSISTGNADVHVLADSERALIAMDNGRWVEAAHLVEGALALIEEHRLDDYAIAVVAFAGAARVALHRGDPASASRELTRAMRARQFCTYAAPALAVRVRVNLAKTYIAMGDHATARHLMRENEEILLRRPALGTLVNDVSAPASDCVKNRRCQPASLPTVPLLSITC